MIDLIAEIIRIQDENKMLKQQNAFLRLQNAELSKVNDLVSADEIQSLAEEKQAILSILENIINCFDRMRNKPRKLKIFIVQAKLFLHQSGFKPPDSIDFCQQNQKLLERSPLPKLLK